MHQRKERRLCSLCHIMYYHARRRCGHPSPPRKPNVPPLSSPPSAAVASTFSSSSYPLPLGCDREGIVDTQMLSANSPREIVVEASASNSPRESGACPWPETSPPLSSSSFGQAIQAILPLLAPSSGSSNSPLMCSPSSLSSSPLPSSSSSSLSSSPGISSTQEPSLSSSSVPTCLSCVSSPASHSPFFVGKLTSSASFSHSPSLLSNNDTIPHPSNDVLASHSSPSLALPFSSQLSYSSAPPSVYTPTKPPKNHNASLHSSSSVVSFDLPSCTQASKERKSCVPCLHSSSPLSHQLNERETPDPVTPLNSNKHFSSFPQHEKTRTLIVEVLGNKSKTRKSNYAAGPQIGNKTFFRKEGRKEMMKKDVDENGDGCHHRKFPLRVRTDGAQCESSCGSSCRRSSRSTSTTCTLISDNKSTLRFCPNSSNKIAECPPCLNISNGNQSSPSTSNQSSSSIIPARFTTSFTGSNTARFTTSFTGSRICNSPGTSRHGHACSSIATNSASNTMTNSSHKNIISSKGRNKDNRLNSSSRGGSSSNIICNQTPHQRSDVKEKWNSGEGGDGATKIGRGAKLSLGKKVQKEDRNNKDTEEEEKEKKEKKGVGGGNINCRLRPSCHAKKLLHVTDSYNAPPFSRFHPATDSSCSSSSSSSSSNSDKCFKSNSNGYNSSSGSKNSGSCSMTTSSNCHSAKHSNSLTSSAQGLNKTNCDVVWEKHSTPALISPMGGLSKNSQQREKKMTQRSNKISDVPQRPPDGSFPFSRRVPPESTSALTRRRSTLFSSPLYSDRADRREIIDAQLKREEELLHIVGKSPSSHTMSPLPSVDGGNVGVSPLPFPPSTLPSPPTPPPPPPRRRVIRGAPQNIAKRLLLSSDRRRKRRQKGSLKESGFLENRWITQRKSLLRQRQRPSGGNLTMPPDEKWGLTQIQHTSQCTSVLGIKSTPSRSTTSLTSQETSVLSAALNPRPLINEMTTTTREDEKRTPPFCSRSSFSSSDHFSPPEGIPLSYSSAAISSSSTSTSSSLPPPPNGSLRRRRTVNHPPPPEDQCSSFFSCLSSSSCPDLRRRRSANECKSSSSSSSSSRSNIETSKAGCSKMTNKMSINEAGRINGDRSKNSSSSVSSSGCAGDRCRSSTFGYGSSRITAASETAFAVSSLPSSVYSLLSASNRQSLHFADDKDEDRCYDDTRDEENNRKHNDGYTRHQRNEKYDKPDREDDEYENGASISQSDHKNSSGHRHLHYHRDHQPDAYYRGDDNDDGGSNDDQLTNDSFKHSSSFPSVHLSLPSACHNHFPSAWPLQRRLRLLSVLLNQHTAQTSRTSEIHSSLRSQDTVMRLQPQKSNVNSITSSFSSPCSSLCNKRNFLISRGKDTDHGEEVAIVRSRRRRQMIGEISRGIDDIQCRVATVKAEERGDDEICGGKHGEKFNEDAEEEDEESEQSEAEADEEAEGSETTEQEQMSSQHDHSQNHQYLYHYRDLHHNDRKRHSNYQYHQDDVSLQRQQPSTSTSSSTIFGYRRRCLSSTLNIDPKWPTNARNEFSLLQRPPSPSLQVLLSSRFLSS